MPTQEQAILPRGPLGSAFFSGDRTSGRQREAGSGGVNPDWERLLQEQLEVQQCLVGSDRKRWRKGESFPAGRLALRRMTW